MPKKPSKRYREAQSLIEGGKTYLLEEAVPLLQKMPKPKFQERVSLSVSLNIDVKKIDSVVRGTVTLPHGTGKTRKVLVFCRGEKEHQAKEAGADYVGAAQLMEKIQEGWMDFDVVVATPDMMRDISRLGKVLGPRGLMPNPKSGTVTEDVAKAVKDLKGGKVEFKMDKLANIHFVIGTLAFKPDQLVENGREALQAIVRARPSTIKGEMIRGMTISSTMSPGIPVSTAGLEEGIHEES